MSSTAGTRQTAHQPPSSVRPVKTSLAPNPAPTTRISIPTYPQSFRPQSLTAHTSPGASTFTKANVNANAYDSPLHNVYTFRDQGQRTRAGALARQCHNNLRRAVESWGMEVTHVHSNQDAWLASNPLVYQAVS
jgi:hypothetical protein